MKLADMIKAYEDEGYDIVQAQARVSQDVVVMNIAASSLKRNVTIVIFARQPCLLDDDAHAGCTTLAKLSTGEPLEDFLMLLLGYIAIFFSYWAVTELWDEFL